MWKYTISFIAGIYCGQTYKLPNMENLTKKTFNDIKKYSEEYQKKK